MNRVERARILVVDDEERMCRSLDSLLTKEGYEVDTAVDGEQAMRLYRKHPHDLVITDIRMPNMDGIRLLRELRKDDPEAMVILMTAYASIDTAVAAVTTGAYDYIMKPIEFTQLRLAVERALEKRELEQAQRRLMDELQAKNEQLNRHIAESNALYEAAVALSKAPDLRALLTQIVGLALQVIKASVGSVMLLDQDSGELTISAAIGLSDEVCRQTRVKLGNSIAGHVAESAEPLLITDIKNDPRFSKYMRGGYESNCLLCAPLLTKDRVLGVINLSDPQEGAKFSDNDLKLLVTFASQAAIAIDDAQNFEQLRKRVDELSVLYRIASELGGIDNSRDMTSLIYNSLRRIMNFDFTVWLSWSERTESLMFSHWEGSGQEQAAQLIGRQVVLKDKTIYSAALRASAVREEIQSLEFFRDRVKTLTAVPIITHGALHGVFCLGSAAEQAISANDEYIASIVTSQATSIYERQQAILNATRLMAMGKMMSEISHDLKKPLTNIRGTLQVLGQRLPDLSEIGEFFSEAEQELLRLNELVRELLDFSNPKKYQLEHKQIPDLFRRVKRLVNTDLEKHKIELIQQLEDSLPAVLINENEIVEVLLNLILNAIDAMPEGGSLTLAAARKEGETQRRPFVEIQVRDTGAGIPPELQDKVFDRYFTTKESGTGLGLAICERIIMAHNGRIELESKVGVGTAFHLWLPSA